MKIEKNKYNCCGCSVCIFVCTKNAISMQPDDLGFLYPVVDDDICIECGKCANVCIFNNHYFAPFKLAEQKFYGGRCKNSNEVQNSQSGGAFAALSDFILDNGGVVYGAGFSQGFKVVHKRATTKEERDEFRGSKYVQSELNDILKYLDDDLRQGRVVMFSGTPCQIAALTSLYDKSQYRKNLYLMDFICHGVPSPFVWKEYVKYVEQKFDSEIVFVNYRDKEKGWRKHFESFVLKKNESRTTSKIFLNYYSDLFYKHLDIRYSCYRCPYTNLNRLSDITVADFWGIEDSVMSDLDDNKGCSSIIVNTEKGQLWFNKICSRLDYKVVNKTELKQPNLSHPTFMNPKRKEFEVDFAKHGFDYVLRKYGNVGINRIFTIIKNIIRPLVYSVRQWK